MKKQTHSIIGKPIGDERTEKNRAQTILDELKKRKSKTKFVYLKHPEHPRAILEVEESKYESDKKRYAGYTVVGNGFSR